MTAAVVLMAATRQVRRPLAESRSWLCWAQVFLVQLLRVRELQASGAQNSTTELDQNLRLRRRQIRPSHRRCHPLAGSRTEVPVLQRALARAPKCA